MWQAFWGRTPPLYDPFSNMSLPYGTFHDDIDTLPTRDDPASAERTVDLLKHQRDGLKPGGLDLHALLAATIAPHQRMPFGEDAVRCLTDEDYARATILNPEITTKERDRTRARSFRTVSRKGFYVAISMLVVWGLFEWCDPAELYTYGRFFLVPKGPEFWRVIVDMRIPASLCLSPPPVNFPLIRTLLIEVASLSYSTGLWAVTGDFAFWFYQIPCSPWLQSLFGVEIENPSTGKRQFARMKCCPMGFSYCPRWAASLGWVVILHRQTQNTDRLGVYEEWSENPPQFVRLRDGPDGKTVGYIFLWIDNIFIITNDQKLRDDWHNRLSSNARYFHCLWKKDTLVKTSSPNYIGIHFRRVDANVRWCHEKERITKWKELVRRPILTPRDVARHVGVAQWHQLLSLQPLFSIEDPIEIGRRISKRIVSKATWDVPLSDLGLSLPEKDIRVLRQYVRRAFSNEEFSVNIVSPQTTVYACTDACKEDQSKLDLSKHPKAHLGRPDNGAGVVVYGPEYHPLSNPGSYHAPAHRWSDEERKQDIHILETRAIKWLILEVLPSSPVPCRLVVGSDSTIAVSAVSKGYSSCSVTRKEVKEIHALCRAKNYVLEVLWIPGDANAADPISRGHDASPFLNERSWELLHGKAPEQARRGRPRLPPMTDEDLWSSIDEEDIITDTLVMDLLDHDRLDDSAVAANVLQPSLAVNL